MTNAPSLKALQLDDKYTSEKGQIFLTGTQALVRLLLMQRHYDIKNGHNTGGFISGYRGSPLGGLDQTLWRTSKLLAEQNIQFTPGINEDLGATAVWGSQQLHLSPEAKVDGVFGMWYGKGPGVDRTGDVLKHANMAGTSRLGGVLALAGDDHACKSSTLPHQTEYAFMDAFIPVIHPASVQDVLDLGLYGWALSRYSGLWVCFKMISDTVDTASSVYVDLDRFQPVLPQDFVFPAGGISLRWPDIPLEQESRMINYKVPAAEAFIKANQLNKRLWQLSPQKRRIGIIAVGKGYIEMREALHTIGIDDKTAQDQGIDILKIVVSWPLDASGIKDFCQGLSLVMVVEEKRPVIETQLKEILYHVHASERPTIIGKTDEEGRPWLPATYEFSVKMLAAAIAKKLQKQPGFSRFSDEFNAAISAQEEKQSTEAKLLRIPYYCSGCPHNTSTLQLPEGSRVMGGIGCHYMATWIDHRTQTFTHMGGEGVPWIGAAPFTNEKHIFSNLGDGTYYHSGLLAIRAAVASKVNITYKILYNDAVAMTGGQPVDGPLSVWDVTQQLTAEGVKKIVVVSDDIEKYKTMPVPFAQSISVYHRESLMQVQEEIKEVPGTTAIIYDQTCAAEKRRRRKRGLMEDPNRRIFINESVCEGCGDCGKKSNCLSVIPLTTEWGRKRAIDQSSCNKDYSCVNGFCPSFVSVIGGNLRKPSAANTPDELFSTLAEPEQPQLDQPYNIFITGVGGTGVVTIGALLGMAAHLEGKGCSVVDMAGLAQKGGAVVSHLRISAKPEDIFATRITDNSADLLLGFDLVVSAGTEALGKACYGKTRAIINNHESITGHFTKNADYVFPKSAMMEDIAGKIGHSATDFIDASDLATRLMGDSIMSNLFMVGYALQKGFLPLSVASILESIRLNGVAVDKNIKSFQWGRLAASDMERVLSFIGIEDVIDHDHHISSTIDEHIARRCHFLTLYQNEKYAKKFESLIQKVRKKDDELDKTDLTKIVSQTYFRLMAYKDEYEVARLYTDGNFKERLSRQFEGNYKLLFHLAPPLFSKKDPRTGELKKKMYGSWIFTAFKVLAKFKFLRGTIFDVFGYTKERRSERQLIKDFEGWTKALLQKTTLDNYKKICSIMELPQKIRGFGHVKENNLKNIMKEMKNNLENI